MRETTLHSLLLMGQRYKHRDTFKRDAWWMCIRYKTTEGPLGDAARRLMCADSIEQCQREDLQVVLDKVWEVSRSGLYASSLRAQGAALRIQALMQKTGAA